MRIGVVSDTHDRGPNVRRIVELLNRASVDWVVHTGDITTPGTLALFSALQMPLFGVYGNNDRDLPALGQAARQAGFEMSEGLARYTWANRRVGIVHDPEKLPSGTLAGCDVLLHGHTHRHVYERVADTLIFNPGECAGTLEGYNRFGILDLTSLSTELVKF